MTPETMSPREKDVQKRVEKIVFEKFYGGPLSGSKERLAAALIAEFNLASLASSGDHAELARLADDASSGPWSVDADDLGRTIVASPVEIVARDTRHNSAFIAAANPATVLALLAENAAMRAANTEAERKLAEAEDENARWAFRFAEVREAAGIGVKPMLSEVPGELLKMRSLINRAADLMRQCTDPERFEGASTLNVYANMRAWLSDLSKEAERG